MRICALIACACIGSQAAQIKSSRVEPELAASLQRLDRWVASAVDERQIPGLSIGVVKGSDLLWAKGYGYLDVEKRSPVTTSTVFRLASVSKLITAAAIMQLRDAGKLQLAPFQLDSRLRH